MKSSVAKAIAYVLLSSGILQPANNQLQEEYSKTEPQPADSNHLTQYLLHRLLGEADEADGAEEHETDARVFSERDAATSFVYPQVRRRDDVGVEADDIKRYLDEAKEHIDVIDFRRSRRRDSPDVKSQGRHLARDEDLSFGSEATSSSRRRTRNTGPVPSTRGSSGSASEQVPVKLAFPGNDFQANPASGCTNCVPEGGVVGNRWAMALHRLGQKQYYMGIFFKANWYKAEQYCRFHGMHLASINTAEEQKDLQDHIQAIGMGHEHFWTSGTDQAEEGKFFWMSTGRPLTYTNWNAGEPNNFEYEDGEQEHCLEMWDRDGKGLGWNDTPCSFQTFFICEATS